MSDFGGQAGVGMWDVGCRYTVRYVLAINTPEYQVVTTAALLPLLLVLMFLVLGKGTPSQPSKPEGPRVQRPRSF